MTFSRTEILAELGLPPVSLWELMLLRMSGNTSRGEHRDQKMGWSDRRGMHRNNRARAKRAERLAQARAWLVGRKGT